MRRRGHPTGRPEPPAPKIPIIDQRMQVVGWTTRVPRVSGFFLRHEEAEALLGGPIACAYIELDGDAAAAAGAPPGWGRKWSCLALTREDASPKTPGALHGGALFRGLSGSAAARKRGLPSDE